jgi:uncharacterized membrane protein
MPTTKKVPVLLASLVAAGVAGTFLLSAGLTVTYEATTTNHFSSSDVSAFFYVWFVAALVAISAALLVGVPSYLILQRIKLLNVFSVCLIGATIGLLVHLTGVDDLSWCACAATGTVSAFFAWLLLRRSNYSFKADVSAAA